MKARIKKTEDEHWQEVRERAAIAAIQGVLSNPNKNGSPKEIAEFAVSCADALVEQLTKE